MISLSRREWTDLDRWRKRMHALIDDLARLRAVGYDTGELEEGRQEAVRLLDAIQETYAPGAPPPEQSATVPTGPVTTAEPPARHTEYQPPAVPMTTSEAQEHAAYAEQLARRG